MTTTPGLTLHQETLHPGQAWSRIIRRHQVIRLENFTGLASVAALVFNAAQTNERYNMPDSLKAQYTAFLTTGRVLMSDMGHVLMSITADTCGWHDTLSGHQDADESKATYGLGSYATLRNDYYRNTRDNFLIELAKHELDRRDLHANVNFFTKVTCADDGRMEFHPPTKLTANYVDLRADMDVLLIFSNTPHPLDPSTTYAPQPVGLTIFSGAPPTATDPCRISRDENARAFTLTDALFS